MMSFNTLVEEVSSLFNRGNFYKDAYHSLARVNHELAAKFADSQVRVQQLLDARTVEQERALSVYEEAYRSGYDAVCKEYGAYRGKVQAKKDMENMDVVL